MANASVPGPLAKAIDTAAKAHNVPVAVLTGIWRIESGSSYPNKFVNSSGYGGLFGTTKWNASPQEQADYAASILSRLIQQYGSLPVALYHYSGGGYTSVDGASNVPYKNNSTRPSVAAVTAQTPASTPAPIQSAYDYSNIVPGPPSPEQTQPLLEEPGTPQGAAGLWQRVVQASASPDPMTLAYSQLAQGG